VREDAVKALAGLVTSDREVRRLLLAKLDDPRSDARGVAVKALAGLAPNAFLGPKQLTLDFREAVQVRSSGVFRGWCTVRAHF
jgi:hypothetical protein